MTIMLPRMTVPRCSRAVMFNGDNCWGWLVIIVYWLWRGKVVPAMSDTLVVLSPYGKKCETSMSSTQGRSSSSSVKGFTSKSSNLGRPHATG